MKDTDKNTQIPQSLKTAVMQSVTENELRIGNYIDLGGDRNLYQVTDEIYGSLNINPVLLTKEWFYKLGMTYYSLPTKSDRKIGYYTIKYGNRFKINSSDGKYSFLNCRKEIKYVHELQNLYFALTGAELTVA